MKRFLSSALKLLLSIAVGGFLIWYFLKDLSKEKNITLTDDLKKSSQVVVEKWLIKDSTLVHIDDPIAVVTADGKEVNFLSPFEGVVRIKKTEGQTVLQDDTIATSKLNRLKFIFDTFKRVNYLWIVVGLLCGICAHMSRAYRWSLLIEVLGYKPKFKNLFASVMVGYLSNLAFPRLGEITKCGVINRYDKVPLVELVGTIVIERIIDVISLLLVFVIAILTQVTLLRNFYDENVYKPISEKLQKSGSSHLLWIILGVLVVLVIVAITIFRKSEHKLVVRLKELIKSLLSGMKTIFSLKRPWAFLFHSILIWTMYFMMVYLCFQCLPETKHFSPMAAMSVLAFGSLGIIAVQGGLGAYPVITALILVAYGLPEHSGFAFGWVAWTTQTGLVLLLGLIAMIALPAMNKNREKGDMGQGTGDLGITTKS